MKIKLLVVMALLISLMFLGGKGMADITPIQAFEMLKSDPNNTFLIDVRTMEEYEFVGHPAMAYNIPFKFWSPDKGMRPNMNFAKDVAEKFKKNDNLILICRSGTRSSNACTILAKEGFKKLFNLTGGFEGDKNKDGYRGFINGWKYDRLPYTCQLDKKLVYKLHTSCGCE